MVLRSPIEWTPLTDTTDKRTGKETCLLQMVSTSRSDVDDVVVGALRPGVSLCPSVRLSLMCSTCCSETEWRRRDDGAVGTDGGRSGRDD